MLLGIVVGACCFAAFVGCQVAASRTRPQWSPSAAIYRLLGAAIVCELVATWLLVAYAHSISPGTTPHYLLSAITGLGTLLALFVLYVPLYYTIAASISVQVLMAIQHSPGMALHVSEIRTLVLSDGIVQRRLESMVHAGNLQRVDSGFRLTRKGRLIARVFGSVKSVWKLGPGG
jgi:hypothetical protein